MSETVDIRELNDLIASKSSFVNMITQGMDQVIVGQKHLVDSLMMDCYPTDISCLKVYRVWQKLWL